MARKRMIDPTIWQDENFGTLSAMARLLFIGLFSNADDEGRIRANDAFVRSTIFMYDDIKLTAVRQLVDEVATKIKNVILYEVDGNRYIQLQKWNDYQKQREDRIQNSALPQCNENNVIHMTDKCQADDGQMSAEVKLDKIRLSKVKLDESKHPHTSLDGLTESDFEQIAKKYKVPVYFVSSKFDDLENYCGSMGKTYKDYYLALCNWVKRDAVEIINKQKKEERYVDNKRGIDASNL